MPPLQKTAYKPHRVAIAVCTYNRSQGLASLLNGVALLKIIEHDITLRVIIVDNSPEANAKCFAARLAQSYRWPLTYRHQPQRGISLARNVALLDALNDDDDYIAFIDDDEYPEKEWIEILLDVALATGATAVSGAVIPRFIEKPDWWMIKGKFFEVSDHPDRRSLPFGHTSNALISLAFLRLTGIRFDPRFSLSGGEDVWFFDEMRNYGGNTVFSRDAVVYEDIVPSRAKLSWLIKRWYRTGNTDGRIVLANSRALTGLVYNFTGGMARILVGITGSALTFLLLTVGQVHVFRFMRIALRGFGFLRSFVSAPYEEYRHHNR